MMGLKVVNNECYNGTSSATKQPPSEGYSPFTYKLMGVLCLISVMILVMYAIKAVRFRGEMNERKRRIQIYLSKRSN